MSLIESRPPAAGDAPGAWRSCQSCRRKDCPCAREQALLRAAAQGRASARLLTEEAARLREAVSAAGDVCGLLAAGDAAEQALSRAIGWETALLQELCARRPCRP